MDDLIIQLRALSPDVNPPAGAAAIQALAASLQIVLPPVLAAIYRDHDGAAALGSLPLRLMSVQEVRETHEALRAFDFPTREFYAFWTDDNSNYACLYVSGLLAGKVCFLDHQEPDLVPVFRSIPSFYAALLQAARLDLGWHEMQVDYPQARHDEGAGEDAALAQQCLDLSERSAEDEQRLYHARCAMNLLPHAQIEPLRRFAEDRDMYIQERACALLGLRRDAASVPLLATIARSGTPNGQIAALRALGRIGTPEAQAELIGLGGTIHPGLKVYLAGALRDCGYETRREGDRWHYRRTASTGWLPL